jgi:hypothetical protein
MCSFREPAHSWSRRACLLAAAGLATRANPQVELRRIPPPAGQDIDPSLASLIARMRKIVAARDRGAMQSLMEPHFRVEFDAGKGRAAFQHQWRPDSVESAVWGILDRMLALPGYAYSGALFALPYVFARFPLDLDLLGHVVAVKEAVAVLAEPRPDAKHVATLDYSIVQLAKPEQPPVVIPAGRYIELNHPSAGQSFVASDNVYHPAAHRSFFEKRAGQWRWISFAAATLNEPPDLLRRRPVSA